MPKRGPQAVVLAIILACAFAAPLSAQSTGLKPPTYQGKRELIIRELKEGERKLRAGELGEWNIEETVRTAREYTDGEIKNSRRVTAPLYIHALFRKTLGKHPLFSRARYFGWRIVLLDDAENKSRAFGDGTIFLTIGLILKTKNEEELAGLLAHEASHVLAGHPWQKEKLCEYLTRRGLPKEAVNEFVDNDLDTASPSFRHQLEADQFALQTLSRLNRDPRSLINFWKRRGVSEDLIAADEAFVGDRKPAKFVAPSAEFIAFIEELRTLKHKDK